MSTVINHNMPEPEKLPAVISKPAIVVKPAEVEGALKSLVEMLAYRRPAGSKTERRFIRDWLLPLGLEFDAYGNLYTRIGRDPILWSCHTDTVHREGGFQTIELAGTIVGLPKSKSKKASNCLGADDTAGIWLMRELILAKKPGLYIFHREEESGGVGSSKIAKFTPNALAGMSYAIALDRRGDDDIITHQGMGRCCSDIFADSLAEQIGLGYKGSSHGIFTDTANYTGLIGECTNLSVGYYGEHTSSEILDLAHIWKLRNALLDLDVPALDYSRVPGEVDPADDYAWGGWRDYHSIATGKVDPRGDRDWSEYLEGENAPEYGRYTMSQIVEDNPDAVADILEEMGYSSKSLADEVDARYGKPVNSSHFSGSKFKNL